MKIGEMYKSKWNRYTAKIVDIGKYGVVLENRQKVREVVSLTNFELNWEPCSIVVYKSIIDEAFTFHNVVVEDDSIIIDRVVRFKIIDDSLSVSFSPSIRHELGLSEDKLNFSLSNIQEVVQMIANLINED